MFVMSPYAETMTDLSSRLSSPSLHEQGEAVHLRHVDVGEDELDVAILLQPGERLDAVAGEDEGEVAGANLAAELLPDQQLEIRFVVDDENLDGHVRSVRAAIPARPALQARFLRAG